MGRYGNETIETVEGHRSTINFADWRPLGWTSEQEARAVAELAATPVRSDNEIAADLAESRRRGAEIDAAYPLRPLVSRR